MGSFVASFTTTIFTVSRLDTFIKPSYIIRSKNTLYVRESLGVITEEKRERIDYLNI